MPEVASLPPLEVQPKEETEFEMETDSEAPYGRKADGTPKKKPGRPAGSNSGTSTGRITRSAKDEAFQEEIRDEILELFSPIALPSPLAYWHIGNRAERTSKACVVLAKKHPAFRHYLQLYFESIAYKEIAMFVTGIPIAFMMDLGMLRPDAIGGRIFKLQEGWEELYGDGGSEFTDAAKNGHREANARGLASQI